MKFVRGKLPASGKRLGDWHWRRWRATNTTRDGAGERFKTQWGRCGWAFTPSWQWLSWLRATPLLLSAALEFRIGRRRSRCARVVCPGRPQSRGLGPPRTQPEQELIVCPVFGCSAAVGSQVQPRRGSASASNMSAQTPRVGTQACRARLWTRVASKAASRGKGRRAGSDLAGARNRGSRERAKAGCQSATCKRR